MFRKLLREYFLLPRGEQRAMLLLSLLVILTLGFRLLPGMLPPREPDGLKQFQEEAMALLDQVQRADSLSRVSLKHRPQTRVQALPPPLDLNKADSADLLKLPGIGPVFAGRIVKYRSLLGGYCSLGQLSEVYGMRQETIDHIAPLLVLDPSGFEKLQVNKIGFRELLRHPYLEYGDVKKLVQYMDLEGAIDSAEEIRSNYLLPESTLERLAPYLDFTH